MPLAIGHPQRTQTERYRASNFTIDAHLRLGDQYCSLETRTVQWLFMQSQYTYYQRKSNKNTEIIVSAYMRYLFMASLMPQSPYTPHPTPIIYYARTCRLWFSSNIMNLHCRDSLRDTLSKIESMQLMHRSYCEVKHSPAKHSAAGRHTLQCANTTQVSSDKHSLPQHLLEIYTICDVTLMLGYAMLK